MRYDFLQQGRIRFRLALLLLRHSPHLVPHYRRARRGCFSHLIKERPLDFILKFRWDYLSTSLSEQQKMLCHTTHYRLIDSTLDSCRFYQDLTHGIVLWERHSVLRHLVILVFRDFTYHEGELVLEYYAENTLLYRIAFTLASARAFGHHQGHCIFIGGSQSHGLQELRRQAARDNAEISPAMALLLTLKAIANVLKFTEIIGVTAERQNSLATKGVASDYAYDQLWSMGYGVEEDGFYRIPLHASREVYDAVEGGHKSRTRKKRKAREDFMQFVASQFENFLGRYKRH